MPTHDEYQDELPAYLANRLDGTAALRMKEHLATCGTCGEIAAAWGQVSAALREGGEEIFLPHPEPLMVRRHALGEDLPGVEALARHLAGCPSCRLEAEVWRARRTGGSAVSGAERIPFARASSRAFSRRHLGTALAAGLLLGIASSWLAVRGREATATRPGAANGPPGDGLLSLNVLPPPHRSGGPEPIVARRPQDPLTLLAVQVTVPERARPEDPFRFEIRDPGGSVRWAIGTTAGRLRSEQDRSEVVVLAIPRAELPPGRYQVRLLEGRDPAARPLLDLPFQVTD
ncbi:MAG: zf-HC2 domain-containing protein [Candidatus Polarisedimenticolia bacterium]